MGLKSVFQADGARWELEAACTPLRCPRRRQPAARCACSQDNASSLDSDGSSDGSRLLTRRQAAVAAAAAAAVFLALQQPRAARASALGPAVDGVWQALGGGPPDLLFPPSFLGVWEVTSTLVRLELPLGPEAVPDMSVVQRARAQDLGRPLRYAAAFVLNARGQPVADRAFNTASLLEAYTGAAAVGLPRRAAAAPATAAARGWPRRRAPAPPGPSRRHARGPAAAARALEPGRPQLADPGDAGGAAGEGGWTGPAAADVGGTDACPGCMA